MMVSWVSFSLPNLHADARHPAGAKVRPFLLTGRMV
jgi:hypothetical protein